MNNLEVRKLIIGKKLEEAKKIASSNGFFLRTVWEDGKFFIVTCDFIEERIDVYIQNGIIINEK
jgi:hypothetical protein